MHCYPRLWWELETPKNCSIASICLARETSKRRKWTRYACYPSLFKIFITAFYDYTRSVVSAYSTGYVSKRGHGSYPSKNEPKWHEIHVKLWCHQKIKAGIIEQNHIEDPCHKKIIKTTSFCPFLQVKLICSLAIIGSCIQINTFVV